MATLSMKQVAAVAAAAGFSGKNLQIAVAVAMGESSNDPNNVNSIGCVGLWQIYGSVHRAAHPSWTNEWLKVPANNATAAMVLFKASGWGPWDAYKNGSYQKFMAQAATAVGNRASADISGLGSSSSGTDNSGSAEIGPAMGAAYDPSTIRLRNAPTMKDFLLMGSKVKGNAKNAVISAEASFTTDQTSQITVQLLDPGFEFLDSGLCDTGTPATLQNLRLVVATTSTGSEAGTPTVTLKCRPETINKLKARTGTLVMASASPSQFVKAECEAVGVGCYIQASPQRVNVSRDIPEQGKEYDNGDQPSSWTTFQRLATELGFIVFEENNTVFFGQPTYFTDRGKKIPLTVSYKTGKKSEQCLNVPECSRSLDDKETTVRVKLPLSRAAEARCGRAMELVGVGSFDGWYMVKSVTYDLAGSTEFIDLEAGTPIDPVAQPPDTGDGTSGSIAGSTGTSNGSWPVPSKYKVGYPFGVKNSGYAAGFHTGSDFPVPTGTDVYAVYDGTIAQIGGEGGAYGNHFMLEVNGRRYMYCHLSRILVSKGQKVQSGQRIAISGATGNVTGPHLHLELRKSPFAYGKDCLDPIPSLMKKASLTTGGSGAPLSGRKGTKAAADFVYWAQTRAGGTYVFGAARNPSNPNQTVFDCSSLVQWALYQVGIGGVPASTFSQIPYFKSKGREITVAQASKTRGAVIYREGGGRDHVVISLGNGKTIEASSPSIGIVNMPIAGRGFNRAFLVPGLRY